MHANARRAAFLLLVGTACARSGPPPVIRGTSGDRPLTADPAAAATRRLDALLDGRIRLIGARGPTTLRAGERAEVTLWFQVEGDVFGDPRVFVHGTAPGGELHHASFDHALLGGRSAATEWRTGDVLEDVFPIAAPASFPADKMELRVGLFEGDRRFPVQPAGAHDGKDRVVALAVALQGAPPADAVVNAKKRAGAIVVDGKLSEPDWAQAEKMGPFIAYDGKQKLDFPTTAKIVWDEQYLYVAFEAADADAFTPYTKRDDPLYDSEAVEIFVDADGDKDEYVELQAAPNDLHFDAAFKGGRRKNFETTYDVKYETKTIVDGTVNDPSDVDRGFVSEWRIPIAELRDVPRPPQVGDAWKINLFRLERVRKNGRVVKHEASAWSSPLSGDFHNLDRFGTLRFVE
jgi:hypothetical protein